MGVVAVQNDLDDAERSMLFVCSATHKTKVTPHLLEWGGGGGGGSRTDFESS